MGAGPSDFVRQKRLLDAPEPVVSREPAFALAFATSALGQKPT
jgi:hypothetical protein